MPIDQMKQVLDSMENSIKLRSQAKAEQRAEEAEREKHAFQQKLLLAAASKVELDATASNVNGKKDAVLRDQLMGFMMAGF